jgi:hypothetical protein
MSLNDLASIAIIVQGILLLVSVGLVWYQLKENTKLIRTSNTQKLVELSSPFYLQIAQDKELAALWLQGAQSLDDLDAVDKERYFSLLTWWLMLHENIYHQWSKKLIEEDTFKSWTLDLEYFAQRQKLGRNWERISTYFEASFAAHVTTIIVRLAKEADAV